MPVPSKTAFSRTLPLVLVLSCALLCESAIAAAMSGAECATTSATSASGTATGSGSGITIQLIMSAAFSGAAKLLVPEYERLSHNTVNISFGSSLGSTPDSIPSRLKRGERFDIVIAGAAAIDTFISSGNVLSGSRVDLAESCLGAAVKSGAPRPDISSVATFKQALLGAKSVGYSDSSSGKYLTQVLFPLLGIEAEMSKTAREIKAVPVGTIVAKAPDAGGVEFGVQQLSELVPIAGAGIDVLGRIPLELQPSPPERFSAGITATAAGANLCVARELIAFLTSPQAAPVIEKAGLTPLTSTPAAALAAASTGLSTTVQHMQPLFIVFFHVPFDLLAERRAQYTFEFLFPAWNMILTQAIVGIVVATNVVVLGALAWAWFRRATKLDVSGTGSDASQESYQSMA